ncbi:uracil-DNA glycosylase [Deferribacteraceae bacterium V6Fe1]|nr:uracil-DNA glycosylase [Deferribacteraceae bacterium V6Fe1]
MSKFIEENFIKDVYGVDEILIDRCANIESGPFDALIERVKSCQKCQLAKSRQNIVFGEGNVSADLMFIGEGPGAEEDKQGRPFVGRAGQLLTKMIQAMGLKREDVYIANIVKCRPPDNRNPFKEEAQSCIEYLMEQIKIVRPKVIICLGSVAATYLLNTEKQISKLRGQFTNFNDIKVMPTFHPAYLLRNPSKKKETWEDLKKVIEFLNLK